MTRGCTPQFLSSLIAPLSQLRSSSSTSLSLTAARRNLDIVARGKSLVEVTSDQLASSSSRRYANGSNEGTTTSEMSDSGGVFVGQEDRYNGIIVDSCRESCPDDFAERLRESLKRWTSENRSTVWFRVYLESSDWIPRLAREGFKFHHAKERYVTMYRWLPSTLECNVPPYAHTNLGVGGFVLDDDTGEILVVKDKRSILSGPARWKLPGGIVDPGEDIPEAVMREVTEETGIETEFESLLGFRHAHGYAFGCSDIYVVARLNPLTRIIRKCEREIADCAWMKLEEYANDPNIVQNNRILARAMLDYTNNRAGLRLVKGQHPLSKEQVSLYLLPPSDL